MKKLIYIVLLSFVMSCENSKPTPPEKLSDEDLQAYREAVINMSEYIVLEDSAYHISISKENAASLGVAPRFYDRIKQDLDYTNYIVKEEYNKKGIPIEMPEYKTDSISY